MSDNPPVGVAEDDNAVTSTPSPATTMKIAVAVLVIYIAFVITLVAMRGDAQWDRLVYLLSGFEAIVFAAIGWIFGTSVARGAVNEAMTAKAEAKEQAAAARQDAQTERQATEAARAERDGSLKDAERGKRSPQASRQSKPRLRGWEHVRTPSRPHQRWLSSSAWPTASSRTDAS